ncbi:phage tail protein [Paenibacillaceae bacterium WGS1546]|uniref:phage tail protein n=1 Tax=Cohnella sp. WGS1546 TaxID=3366810 RepID=UPI00372D5FFD
MGLEQGMTFFSLNRKEHWQRRGWSGNLDAEGDVRLRSGRKYGITDTVRLEALEGVGEIAAFAVGPLGRLVLLDDRGDLWLYDRRGRHHERLFVARHGLFSASSYLTVSGDTLFVADPEGERSLAAFDMANGQTKWSRAGETLQGVRYRPLALASDDRYVYALTATAESAEDATGRLPLALIRLTLSGTVDSVFSDGRFAIKTGEGAGPGAPFLAASRQGDVYIFDSLGRTLFAFGPEGTLHTRMVLPPLSFAGIGVDSFRQIYVGDSRIIGAEDEDDRFILHFGENGELIGRVAGFRGKTDGLQIDEADNMYILSAENRTITVLDLQPQTTVWEETGAPEGVWLSRALDSAEAETVWHKFTLDASIPDGTQLRVRYFASDTPELVLQGTLRKVDDWIARADISFEEKRAALAPYWSEPVANPQDALFFGAKGRYLWLQIEWIGSERLTPALRRMRVYFPRETPLVYLPAVYQEDAASRDFLERFLSLFGTLLDSIEEQIDGMARQFDRDRTNGRSLRWLASWLGMDVDESWTDEWVRRFLRIAPELYRYRGTKRGIEKAVEIFTGMVPIVVESFQYKSLRDKAELRSLVDGLYGDDPFTFTVLLHRDQAPSEKEKVLLRRLIDDFKPAHTDAKLVWLEPRTYLDLHTYLGMNTVLAEPSLFTLSADRLMPNDTLLVDIDMNRRLDAHTRLELDSELE